MKIMHARVDSVLTEAAICNRYMKPAHSTSCKFQWGKDRAKSRLTQRPLLQNYSYGNGNEWWFRSRYCTVRLYWGGDKLGKCSYGINVG